MGCYIFESCLRIEFLIACAYVESEALFSLLLPKAEVTALVEFSTTKPESKPLSIKFSIKELKFSNASNSRRGKGSKLFLFEI